MWRRRPARHRRCRAGLPCRRSRPARGHGSPAGRHRCPSAGARARKSRAATRPARSLRARSSGPRTRQPPSAQPRRPRGRRRARSRGFAPQPATAGPRHDRGRTGRPGRSRPARARETPCSSHADDDGNPWDEGDTHRGAAAAPGEEVRPPAPPRTAARRWLPGPARTPCACCRRRTRARHPPRRRRRRPRRHTMRSPEECSCG